MIMAKAANTSNKQIETLADLTPDPRNARKHNPRNVGMLEKSLNEVGAARSIVIDENGVVLAGNATIEAAGRAGIERVQVVDADGETIVAVRRTGLTQTQKTRLALYDNRTAELADWDAEVIADLMANERAMLDGLFENNELLELIENIEQTGSADAEPQIDRAAELNEKWQVKPQDLWRIGNHRLLCGDCTVREDVQRVMGGEQAQMCFTSPPYNQQLQTQSQPTGMHKNNKWFNRLDAAYADNMPESEYQTWQVEVLNIVFDVVKEGGACFYNHKYRYRERRPIVPLDWIRKSKWEMRQEIIWDRGGGVAANAEMFIPSDERIYWLEKTGTHIWNGIGINSTTVWSIHPQANNGTHVCPYPLQLLQLPILCVSNEGAIIVDPFLGSGTTMVASENLQRKCFGIEISPNYCAVILERMQTAFPALVIERIT